MSRRFLTALVVCVALAAGTARVAAQSVFEPALDTWTLDDTKGKVSLKQKCGVDGQRPCILIEGAKGVDTYALSPQIPDAMRDGLTFHLSAVVKTTSKMYLEIDGVSFDFDPTSTSSALATNRTDLPDGWAEISAFVRLREDTKRKIIIGVNNRDGTCYVDRVALARVTPVRITEDPKYPALAQDEAVYENGTFVSTIFADRHYTAVNPHITVMSAKWDTSRATFTKGRNVTFDYKATAAALKEPLTLEIDVSYVSRTTAYLALLESSDAGKTWTEVGTFGSEVKIYTLALSSVAHSMFCVKIASSEGTIYVKKIRVTSTVKTKPSAAVYGKQVFQIAHEENGVALRIAEKLDAKGEFGITLTNTGNATVDRFKIGYNRVMIAGPSVSSDVAEGSIAKGESLSTVGKVRFSSSNNNIVYYTVSSSDGTVTYASGRFVTAKTHFFDDENFGNYIAEDSAHGTLWWCGSTYKVSKRRAAPEQATKKSAIDVYAAKNEFEAFQLVLKASSSEQTISDVSVTTLTSVDDKSVVIDDISVRRVMYVKTEHPTDEDYGRAGEYWPDPLLPLDLPYKCPAGENCPFWVLVHVPFGAKEGSYKGTVSLTASGKKMSSDVTLTVWNFTIPKKQRMRSLFGVEYTYIEAYHHLEDANSTFQKAVYDKYLTSLSKHRISPLYGYPFYWPSTKYVDGKLEYNRFDRHIERLKYLNSEDGFGFASNTM